MIYIDILLIQSILCMIDVGLLILWIIMDSCLDYELESTSIIFYFFDDFKHFTFYYDFGIGVSILGYLFSIFISS